MHYKLEEASTDMSAMTHVGNVFLPLADSEKLHAR